MKKKQKAAWFLSGVLATVLITSMLSPALALFTKTIQVYPGINFYVDDRKLTPKDSNGNPIEAFMYNDYTYLPVRAVSEALDIPIQWDGSTQSVYIGKHTGDKPAVWIGELNYFDRNNPWYFNKTTKDNLGKEHNHSIQCDTNYGGSITYNLYGKYSFLTGVYYKKYDYRSSGYREVPLSIYADGSLIWRATAGCGIAPVEINLNVSNVKELKFVYDSWGCNETAIGELGLWT